LGGRAEVRLTLFEYLAIAFSLVFSFAAMRLVGGLPYAVDPDRRYWVHVTLVVVQLFSTVGVFWVFWSFRDVEWNLARFLLALSSPALIYFNACVLVPEVPGSIESWRDYYFATCQRYFAGVIAWTIAVMATSTIILDIPLIHPIRGIQAIYLVVGILGVSTRNPRVHAGIAVFFICMAPLIALSVGLRPGPLVR
jgi:hypothetical protein